MHTSSLRAFFQLDGKAAGHPEISDTPQHDAQPDWDLPWRRDPCDEASSITEQAPARVNMLAFKATAAKGMKTVKRDHRQLVRHACARTRFLAYCKVEKVAWDTDGVVFAVHVVGYAPYSR
eukprot:7840665-Alexandrium_andersonii.AAC.1